MKLPTSGRREAQATLLAALLIFCAGLSACKTKPTGARERVPTPSPAATAVPLSNGFDYPFGNNPKTTKPEAGWYDAQKFGENTHLGEDWNRVTGGDSDCGLPVYAASKGVIVFAGDAGAGWGKVLIVRHKLSDARLVETLYGHLQSFGKTSGEVERRERIGSIGDGGGKYPCHLHFEVRLANCPAWGQPGPGYSADRHGWADPSEFIGANRSLKAE